MPTPKRRGRNWPKPSILSGNSPMTKTKPRKVTVTNATMLTAWQKGYDAYKKPRPSNPYDNEILAGQWEQGFQTARYGSALGLAIVERLKQWAGTSLGSRAYPLPDLHAALSFDGNPKRTEFDAAVTSLVNAGHVRRDDNSIVLVDN